MSLSRLRRYLDKNSIQYALLPRSPISAAEELAVSVHVPMREWAKTVVVKIDGELAMAVLPASFRIDFELFKREAHVKSVQLATEDEYHHLFPECEIGAMPPIGNLYGLEVFVDEVLSRNKEIMFNAWSRHALVRMPWGDFERLTRPKIIRLATGRATAAAA